MTASALDATSQTVLRMLTAAADAGERCPSNNDILAAVGLSSPAAGPRILKRLELQGLIEVESGQCARVVTIVATGRRTAGTAGRLHWRFRPESRHKLKRNYAPIKSRPVAIVAPEPCLIPVHRDPCPRCGVREDVGCQHIRKCVEKTGLGIPFHTQGGA